MNNSGDQDRILAAVAKLIELTQLKSILWSADDDGAITDTTGNLSARDVYVAQYEGRTLRISERKVPAPLNPLRRPQAGRAAQGFIWRPTLELSQPDSNGWWSFPKVDAIADLLRAVKYQVNGIDDFVNKLLNS